MKLCHRTSQSISWPQCIWESQLQTKHCSSPCIVVIVLLSTTQPHCTVEKNALGEVPLTAANHHFTLQFSSRDLLQQQHCHSASCQMFRSNLPRRQFFAFSLICLAPDSSWIPILSTSPFSSSWLRSWKTFTLEMFCSILGVFEGARIIDHRGYYPCKPIKTPWLNGDILNRGRIPSF